MTKFTAATHCAIPINTTLPDHTVGPHRCWITFHYILCVYTCRKRDETKPKKSKTNCKSLSRRHFQLKKRIHPRSIYPISFAIIYWKSTKHIESSFTSFDAPVIHLKPLRLSCTRSGKECSVCIV